MKHAGIHWPENAGGEHPSREAIVAMPGMAGATLICSPSARYHYEFIRQQCPSALVVWRAVPRQGKLPAQLGWDSKRVADECLNLWDEQPHHGAEWFTPLNELQFVKENGAPFPGYGPMAQNLAGLRVELRRRFAALGQTVRLVWPAWVPSDDGDFLDDWRHEANNWDVIGLHCYGSAETMRARYQSYRDAFPHHPIFVGEWNSNHEGHDERASLEMWAEIANTDPAFLGAAYYIWETNNAGERDLSIWGNPDRLALFLNPPAATENPVPVPEPPIEEPAMPPRGVDVASYQGYPDWHAVAASGIEFAFTKATEDTGYVNPTFGHNWAGIKSAGIIRGVYHFARPGVRDAVAEADYCLDVVDSFGGFEPGDLFALDLESGSGDLGQWTLDFLRHAELRCGFKPLVYTGAWFSGPHNLGAYPEIGEYGLWLAAYQSEMPAPPAPWDTVAFWQYSSSGQVPGISGDVDMNVFNGPADRIALYGKPGETPAPVPEPVPPSEYAVGPGILAAMSAHGDVPASDERYVSDDWSEAFGASGCRYVWLPATGRVHRYDPAA
jgi:lysozyme